MFKFIKQAFIALFCFSESLATKCLSLSDGPYLVRATFINLNSYKLHYYPYMVSLDRRNKICNTLDNPYAKICLPHKTEDETLNICNMIARINKAKTLT